MNQLIDIGINLMHRQFSEDRKEVLERALASGVEKMILTGTSVRNSQESSRFAKNYSGVLYSTAGIHPHDAKHFSPRSLDDLRRLAKETHVVAIGECGLDFNRNFSTPTEQEACFEAQIELSREVNLPLFLHERDAFNRFVEIMDHHQDRIPFSVVHCFTGNATQAKEYIKRGFYIGVTGWICDDRRGKNLQEAVKHIPLDRIMLETDAPFLIPRPKTGRNEPANLPVIAQKVAKCMNVSVEKLIEASSLNTRKLFAL